ncbi:hypothetical protein NLU13_6800 [Sarocladium strictum]|uniref:Zn(2)-C6 fungal-type domain-containing protein n=1 Tax=Sarocladium strictum TaxID=5046 RepID=A0AA39L657_SARSR|nr:hypothetical protein NLU13_6800 [Sarocladium strictum]
MPRRRACDVCYRRKIQCLIDRPGQPCDWCTSQRLQCTFARVIQKDPNKKTVADNVQALSRRVKELEEALQAAQQGDARLRSAPGFERASLPAATSGISAQGPSPLSRPLVSSHSTASSPLSNSVTSPHDYQAGTSAGLSRCQLGSNWYFKGVGILSSRGREWISDGAGQRAFLERFNVFECSVDARPPHASGTWAERPLSLPAEPISRRLFAAFLETDTFSMFPILEKELFDSTIGRAYAVTPLESTQRASAEACLWAMLALAGCADRFHQINLIPQPEQCVQQVKRLSLHTCHASNLDSLQATLLVWAYQKMKGRCREASASLTSACRMVCDLGGHFHLSNLTMLPQHIPIIAEPARQHIRRLFWICYCFDKEASLRTGSPPVLTSDLCDMRSCSAYNRVEPSCCHRCRDISLARIKEHALQVLCSPNAFRYTDGELAAYVRQLDDELEDWRMAIAPPYRPRLSIPPESTFAMPLTASKDDRTHIVKLQLDYLFTMINIHFLVRKCGNFERNLPDDLHSVVHSSADLSLEASRSIFHFLDTVVRSWKEASVWIVSHYTLIAAMPLFINILIHPVGFPADKDLQILSSVGSIARSVPTERLFKEDIEQIQEVVEFVMELVRLGHSAAWKAKKGERELDLDIIYREEENEV